MRPTLAKPKVCRVTRQLPKLPSLRSRFSIPSHGPGAAGVARYVARIDRRGRFTFDHLAVSTCFPFGIVEIRFDIPTARDVQLRIYNQLGQTVRTLVDQRMKAGTHALQWDGADAMGRAVASGVYFYNLEAGDFSQIRKMTLVK